MNPFIQLLSLSLILTIFTQFTTPVNAYTRIGNMIRDLEANDTRFESEASLWNISPKRSPMTTQCEGTHLLGGYHILTTDGSFRRTYYDLPPHDIIYYSIYASFIDEWYYNASFIVHFDNRHAAVGVFLFNHETDFDRNYCGDPDTKDLQGLVMSGKIYHNNTDNLTLNVWTINHYAPNIRAFGFRDIVLHFRNKTKREAQQNCAHVADLSHPIPLGGCVCAPGEFLPQRGPEEPEKTEADCLPCDPLCETCLGPSTSQCLKCRAGAFFDGTDCRACHPSCATCSKEGDNQCLSCPVGVTLIGGRCVDITTQR